MNGKVILYDPVTVGDQVLYYWRVGAVVGFSYISKEDAERQVNELIHAKIVSVVETVIPPPRLHKPVPQQTIEPYLAKREVVRNKRSEAQKKRWARQRAQAGQEADAATQRLLDTVDRYNKERDSA